MRKITHFIMILTLGLATVNSRAEEGSKTNLLTSIEKSLSLIKDLDFKATNGKGMMSVCLSLGATKAVHSQLVYDWNKYAGENFSKALLDEELSSNLVNNQKHIGKIAKACWNDEAIDHQELKQSVNEIKTRLTSFINQIEAQYGVQRTKAMPAAATN